MISQNSPENTCVGISQWPTTLSKKSLQHMCFSVNFAKILRISFLHNTSGWLIAKKKSYVLVLNYEQILI